MALSATSIAQSAQNKIIHGVYHFSPTIQGLFGARYQKLDVDISLPGPLPTASGDEDWVGGFVGVRLVPVNTDKWRVWLRGDIGGGASDFTWNAVAGAGYRFNKNWSGLLAYRVLSTDYSKDGFKWDVDLSGLGLAVGYTFNWVRSLVLTKIGKIGARKQLLPIGEIS